MSVKISFRKSPPEKADTAIAIIYKGSKMGAGAEKLDKTCSGLIRHHLKKQKNFTGQAGQTLMLSPAQGSRYTRIILLGLGDPAKPEMNDYEAAGGKLYLTLAAAGAVKVMMACDGEKTKDSAAHIAMGLKLRSYSFDKYKTTGKKKGNTTEKLKTVDVTGAPAAAAKKFKTLEKVASGMFWARDLVNEPPNILYPDSFAKRIKSELAPLGVDVEVIGEKRMKELGFYAHLAVGMASAFKPRVVIMRWHGGKKTKSKTMQKPLAFVGKGLTFDTGGVNIKPSGGMEEMKLDMGGAAAVVGLMKSLALRKSKAQVIGIVGLAENAVDGTAYRPSDVLKTMNGKTVEVMNTDAEGRLVLADCMTYVQRKYKPRLMIDLATLTGAMMIALGTEYCGVFANDDKMWKQMESASANSGEKLWRMPLDEAYRREMDSAIADVKTLGGGRYGGACTAGVKADKPTCPKPATGFGVRVLDRFVADHYE